MYYQNGNYIQDLNYYNQNPNYNPYGNNFQMQNGNPGTPMGQMPAQNLSAMYPAVYRIISPVVSQVLSGNNNGYITEESLNNMVDTIYNIVEGDINLGNQINTANSNNATGENVAANNCERNSPTSRGNTTNNTASAANSQNTLLRDLIKIMILNEISSRRQNNWQTMAIPYTMQNTNMSQPMFR